MSLFEARRESDSTPRTPERVLVVHAHPDDETLVSGATLATLADAGARLTVVTCTRGELGEVMPDDLAALRGDESALAHYRVDELATAMAALGVNDHRFLGADDARAPGLAPRNYRDSGMEWASNGRAVSRSDQHPASFCAAPFAEIVSDLGAVIDEVRPDAVIGYDEDGGYGHPDHVRAGHAALAAARRAGVPYFAITTAAGERQSGQADVVIDGRAVLSRKVAALRAYRTQIRVLDRPEGPALEFPHGAVQPVSVVETFRFVAEPAPAELPERPPLADIGPAGRVLAYVAALAVGAFFGAIGTVTHQISIGPVPIGVVLALAMTAGLVIGTRLYVESRFLGVLVAFGIVGATAVLMLPGSGGSVLVPANPAGYAWTFGPTVIAIVALAWPRLPHAPGAKLEPSSHAVRVVPEAKEQSPQ